jgi:RNA polymerase sigma factor (sigma-70 family)
MHSFLHLEDTVTDTELRKQTQGSYTDTVRLAASGDAAAFAQLIESNEGMLYRVCRTILRSEADCADAVQDTVITAWQQIGKLRNSASFPAWAARICINRCYRRARGSRPQEAFAEPVVHGANDAKLDVMQAIQSLPEELRLTVVFYYFEDWSVEEIARALGTFQGTVKSRLHRARQLLASSLRDYREGNRYDA